MLLAVRPSRGACMTPREEAPQLLRSCDSSDPSLRRTSRHGDPKRGRDLDWRVRILIRKVNQLGTCFGLPSPICCASCGFSDHPPVRVKKEDPPIGLGSDSTDKVPRKVSKPFRRSRRVPNHDSTPKLGSAQEERIERSTRR